MKIVPRFWWDFIDNATYIIVQSDHPKYPILKKIKIPGLDATSQSNPLGAEAHQLQRWGEAPCFSGFSPILDVLSETLYN